MSEKEAIVWFRRLPDTSLNRKQLEWTQRIPWKVIEIIQQTTRTNEPYCIKWSSESGNFRPHLTIKTNQGKEVASIECVEYDRSEVWNECAAKSSTCPISKIIWEERIIWFWEKIKT